MTFRKNQRIRVVKGPKAGKTGKIIRKYNRTEWMVKLDDRISADYFTADEIERDTVL